MSTKVLSLLHSATLNLRDICQHLDDYVRSDLNNSSDKNLIIKSLISKIECEIYCAQEKLNEARNQLNYDPPDDSLHGQLVAREAAKRNAESINETLTTDHPNQRHIGSIRLHRALLYHFSRP